jgi:hypothetical protein
MHIQSFCAGSLVVGSLLIGASAQAAPEHLELAAELAATIKPSTNYYGGPTVLSWAGENGLSYSKVVAKCSTFVTELLKKAYDVDIKEWFGAASPHAACYHDTIEVEDGFTLIESIKDVKPGDIIAIADLDAGCDISSCGNYSGCGSTGHVMLVAAAPVKRNSSKPLVSGTLQYTLEIIDVTSSPHGDSDSRTDANPNHSDDSGVGTGTIRLYVDADDADLPIVGHTWTTSTGSTYRSQAKRSLVIGRYVGP